MIGPIFNAAAIVIGGIVGLLRKKPLSVALESWMKLALGVFTVFYGLRLAILSLGGSFGHILKQILLLVLSLFVGRLIGRLLRLQKFSNRIGQKAKETLSAAASSP